MKIGLFFGSFNPVHVGHLIIAQHLVNQSDLDQVWMVVSPHNPLKEKAGLANDHDRLYLVRLATENHPKIKASSIEFGLPKPSYTVDTLAYLKEKYPDYNFSLIMGGDNLAGLNKWKNYKYLIDNYDIYVYKRPNAKLDDIEFDTSRVIYCDAPLLDISSTMIRTMLAEGKSIQFFVPEVVYKELMKSSMYPKKKYS